MGDGLKSSCWWKLPSTPSSKWSFTFQKSIFKKYSIRNLKNQVFKCIPSFFLHGSLWVVFALKKMIDLVFRLSGNGLKNSITMHEHHHHLCMQVRRPFFFLVKIAAVKWPTNKHFLNLPCMINFQSYRNLIFFCKSLPAKQTMDQSL